MDWKRPLAALFVVLAFTGCAPLAGGQGQAPNAPYQQDDTRYTRVCTNRIAGQRLARTQVRASHGDDEES